MEKRPSWYDFQNSVPNVFTASPIDVVVFKSRKIFLTRSWRKHALFTGQKNNNKISAPYQTVADARIAPKMCQLPTFGSQCSRFHPNRFTFGGVIAERVNTVLLPCRVFPIFTRAITRRVALYLEIHCNMLEESVSHRRTRQLTQLFTYLLTHKLFSSCIRRYLVSCFCD